MNDEIWKRISRLYAALDATIETDMDQLPAEVICTETVRGFHQDFSGGKSQEELENALQNLIACIASLEYHLRKAVADNGDDPDVVSIRFKDSKPLQLVHDLWNNDKHGAPQPGKTTYSGMAPLLKDVHSAMVLQTQAKKGSWIAMTGGLGGMPQIHGDGSAHTVITADIVDGRSNDQKIADAHTTISEAVAKCEELFKQFGIA